MSDNPDTSNNRTTTRGHGRGRGKTRGGLGKYLRARGRGRGSGRPAEFRQRLLLDGEGKLDLTEEEAAELDKELSKKYGKRKLGTNADRYKEEVAFDSDGEPTVEPDIDLSLFLERQRLSDDVGLPFQVTDKGDVLHDVDKSLAHISSDPSATKTHLSSKKGKVQHIEWDEGLDEMNREKKAAEASRELKDRFKSKSDKLRMTTSTFSTRRKPGELQEAPALPLPGGPLPSRKKSIEEMEDFLDDLLT